MDTSSFSKKYPLFFLYSIAGSQMEEHYKQEALKAKSFVSWLELNYGDKTRNMKKWIYMPYPYDVTMRDPLYGYVENSYKIDHHRFLEEPERYGIVALVREEISSLPYNELVYKYLRKSDSFAEKLSPFSKEFILFIHRDIWTFK